jgi:hypothetical protein
MATSKCDDTALMERYAKALGVTLHASGLKSALQL